MNNEIEGKVVTKSDRNFGIKIGTAWYNAHDDASKEMITKVDKDYNVKLEVDGNRIVRFLEVTEPKKEDLNATIEENSYIMSLCRKQVDQIFNDSEDYRSERARLVCALFHASKR